MSASATATSSRSRPQARKKANDDASYFGPSMAPTSSTGSKRQAAEKLEGEPRVKRKRVEATTTTQAASTAKRDTVETEVRVSMVSSPILSGFSPLTTYFVAQVEFNKMSIDALERYMAQFDIIPDFQPSPSLPDDPPPPTHLASTYRLPSRAPSPPPNQTPANRPHRESREANRRSSRLLEEELPYRTPSLTDLADLQGVLAKIVEKHFRESLSISGRDELDALAAFMTAVEKSRSRSQPNVYRC